MKILLCIIISFLSFADEFQFLSNYRTNHWSSFGADRFENKKNKSGKLIANPIYGISILEKKDDSFFKRMVFVGKDSINTDMFGFAKVNGWHKYNDFGVNVGSIFGLYFFDQRKWDKKYDGERLKTPSIITATTGIENVNIILGINIDISIPVTDKIRLKFDNVITPMITTHSFAITFDF